MGAAHRSALAPADTNLKSAAIACATQLAKESLATSRRLRLADTNWDLFRLFFAVAQSGSVSRAARELKMSQPTLSRRLNDLECCIGAPLFFRVSSGMKLTQEGEELRRSADEMVRSFDAFHRDLSLRVSDRSSAVKISATQGLTKHWLLPRVNKLRAVNRQVRLEISSTVEQQNLAASDLDFVIRMGDPRDNDLVGRKVATTCFGLFASESYLESRGEPRALNELVQHDIIGGSDDFPGFRNETSGQMNLLTAFKAAGNARGALRLMPVASHFDAAREGLGVAFLTVPFALAEGLVRVLPGEASLLDVWLLRRRESDLRKMTKQVCRFLETEFAGSKAWFAGEKTIRKRLQRTA
jgi:DNA-binding transcriptional LysR family regulator